MIVRVWGTVNSTEVEFTPIRDKPGYWEGYAPRVPGLQDIEIWAESSTGAAESSGGTEGESREPDTAARETEAVFDLFLVLGPFVKAGGRYYAPAGFQAAAHERASSSTPGRKAPWKRECSGSGYGQTAV